MTAAAFAGVVLAGGTRAIIGAVLSPPVILLYVVFAVVVLYVSRRLRQHERTMPLLAVPCPSCTGRPMEFPDCTCREDCGESWCQAADPEEPMFYEFGHVVGRDGREAILARAREEDRAEADAPLRRRRPDLVVRRCLS